MHVETQIIEVTVYERQAQVLREGRVPLSAGACELRVGPLPLGLTAESVRVRGVGEAAVHGFDLKTRHLERANSEQAAAFAEMLVALDDEEQSRESVVQTHEAKLGALRDTMAQLSGSFVRQVAEGKANAGEWQALLAFLEMSQRQESEALLGLERYGRELEARRRALETEHDKLTSFHGDAAYEVVVAVEAAAAMEFGLIVEYVVDGASWTPLYEARLSAAGDRLTWRYGAMVRQSTGEHWEDVRLRLSTARPAEGAAPPPLPDWTLDLYMPAPPMLSAPAPMAAKRSRASLREIGGEYEEFEDRAPEPTMAMVDQGTSVSLEVPRPLTIPSSGEPHQALVGDAEFPPTLRYRVVPKLVAQAFLEVETVHSGPWPILAGPVKCFVGQDYVGTTRLDEDQLPGATFSLQMGVDRAIQVKRTRLKRQSGETSLINKQRYHDYAYEILIANHKAKPQHVTVVEPLPVSERKELKVKLADMSPAPQEQPGRLEWAIAVEPQETQRLTWGYRVEYPTGLNIVGLE